MQPQQPQRVVVTGSSGSGKTTLARRVAARLACPHVELDALHHLPGWQEAPLAAFREAVDAATPRDGRWVVDGNYRSKVADIAWARADTVVFLDLPRWRVMTQLVPRTLRRVLLRQELWNGNREQLGSLLSRDPHTNVVLWSWSTHARRRTDWERVERDPAWHGTTLVRLRGRRDAQRWTASLGTPGAAG